jgi:hypothetical protein
VGDGFSRRHNSRGWETLVFVGDGFSRRHDKFLRGRERRPGPRLAGMFHGAANLAA